MKYLQCYTRYQGLRRRVQKTPALNKNPQVKVSCIKTFILTPKKPNSAKRKVAKVDVHFKRKTVAYIPGMCLGDLPNPHNWALMRGGRVQDLPAVKYHLIRGKFDIIGLKERRQARSKYGMVKEKRLSGLAPKRLKIYIYKKKK